MGKDTSIATIISVAVIKLIIIALFIKLYRQANKKIRDIKQGHQRLSSRSFQGFIGAYTDPGGGTEHLIL